MHALNTFFGHFWPKSVFNTAFISKFMDFNALHPSTRYYGMHWSAFFLQFLFIKKLFQLLLNQMQFLYLSKDKDAFPNSNMSSDFLIIKLKLILDYKF